MKRKSAEAESPPEPPAPPSFEAMMAEIERITALLERGELPLQESLAAFERASRLTRDAQALLSQAELRLTRLVEGASGEVVEVPFSLEESPSSNRGDPDGQG